MIRILARKNNRELLTDVSLAELPIKDIAWYWVDFEAPTKEEIALLSTHFHFHSLSIEDCLGKSLERPNAYVILDKIVDSYFPVVYRTEDALNEVNTQAMDHKIQDLIDQVFEIRIELLKLRHIVDSMKELMYRIIQSEHLQGFHAGKRYLNDIYDYLLRLSDMIESNREVTADVRDNCLSVNSNKMNRIMTFLTIITSLFIPLTFIVGIYGMNFDYMPELCWRYGYFITLGAMVLVVIFMLLWFKRKGWFDFRK